jgi:hypothetical protein
VLVVIIMPIVVTNVVVMFDVTIVLAMPIPFFDI